MSPATVFAGPDSPMQPLERARSICLALPETTEKIAWGAPTFRIRERMFAIFADNHHGDGRIALWCNAPPGAQHILSDSEPGRFFNPPYMGPRGWVGLVLERLDDARLALHVKESYRMVAPKRLLTSLDEERPKPVPSRRRKA